MFTSNITITYYTFPMNSSPLGWFFILKYPASAISLQRAFEEEFQIAPFRLTSSPGPVEKLVNAFVGTPVLDASTRYKAHISAPAPLLN